MFENADVLEYDLNILCTNNSFTLNIVKCQICLMTFSRARLVLNFSYNYCNNQILLWSIVPIKDLGILFDPLFKFVVSH